jgi:class 3 adenylate cyclase/pimeloyl-ACP methyl ester carboxylesterase
MNASGPKRRLAALMMADVASYSRLVEHDESGTVERVQRLRGEVLEPAIAEKSGRLVKSLGDGFLAEFGSVVDATACAVTIQDKAARATDQPPNGGPLQLRIGVHIGDVLVEGGDLLGDGVNVVARVQAAAVPGSVCLSIDAYRQVEGKLPIVFEDVGEYPLKNIARPMRLYLHRCNDKEGRVRQVGRRSLKQEINFCRSPDGVRIAWAKVGSGPPLMKAANYINHLKYDWDSPVWRHILEGLALEYTLVRYDARGNGLSDWEVEEISLDAWVRDLETVVDAAGLERFPLLGVSQGAAVSIAYAVRNPERVSHLIIYGGYALGMSKQSPEARAKRDAMATLTRLGWGIDDTTFRQMFTSIMMPDASKADMDAMNVLQQRTTSPECAERYFRTTGDLDVRELLPRVRAPTLVMHARGDLMVPLELGRQLAAGIPGARFLAFEGRNHILREGEPAFERFFEELRLFLEQRRDP